MNLFYRLKHGRLPPTAGTKNSNKGLINTFFRVHSTTSTRAHGDGEFAPVTLSSFTGQLPGRSWWLFSVSFHQFSVPHSSLVFPEVSSKYQADNGQNT